MTTRVIPTQVHAMLDYLTGATETLAAATTRTR